MFREHSTFYLLSLPVRAVRSHSFCGCPTQEVSSITLIFLSHSLCFQFFVFTMVRTYPFYDASSDVILGDLHARRCLENTGVFVVSQFQYVIYGVVLCAGPPFRQ